MKRWIGMLAVVAIGVTAYGVSVQPWQTAAQEARTVTIEAVTNTTTDSADGEGCFPWGLLDAGLAVRPFRQLIVTDQSGTIGGAVDLRTGVLTTDDSGQRACTIRQEVTLPPATFYTFAGDGLYRQTIADADLDAVVVIALPAHP